MNRADAERFKRVLERSAASLDRALRMDLFALHVTRKPCTQETEAALRALLPELETEITIITQSLKPTEPPNVAPQL